ncbi:MAG: hypothetical protein V1750_08765, partial [Acidobacteriota bacterium]
MFPVIPIVKKKKKDDERPPQEGTAPGQPIAAADSRRFVNGVSATAATIVWVAGVIAAAVTAEVTRASDATVFAIAFGSVLAGLYLMFALKVANQWEKAV